MFETKLEMIYHEHFVKAFARVYGENVFQFFKPSTNKECWQGYDQAWVKTKMKEDDFFKSIKQYNNQGTQVDEKVYFAFFFQYKVSTKLSRKNKNTTIPPNFIYPFWRFNINLKVNPKTNLSQHQCLYKLSLLEKSIVMYVTPLVNNINTYNVNVNALHYAKVSPKRNYNNGEKHTVNFQDYNSRPIWQSEPSEGELMSFEDILRKENHIQMSGKELIQYLTECKEVILKDSNYGPNEKICNVLPLSLMIISIKKPNIETKTNSDIDPFNEEDWSI